MDAQNFVYWLKGFVEMTESKSITESQWKMIKEHLALVGQKITPTLDKNFQDKFKELEKGSIFRKPVEYWRDTVTYPQPQPYWLQGTPYNPLTPIC